MKTEKTNKLLRKTIDTAKEQAKTIADLRLEAARTPRRIQDAVDTAVAATIGEWSARLLEAERRVNECTHAARAEREQRFAAEAARDSNGAALLQMADRVAHESARADAAEQELAAMAAKEADVKAKEKEIRDLVDTVQARMRRREIEEANAILNRQAVSGLAPTPRRG